MTVTEIYEEYRLQPGSTVLGALGKTVIFMTPVGKAWGYGTIIGTFIYKFAIAINPDFGYGLVAEPPSFFEPPLPSGQGYVENPDGSITDGYGNTYFPNMPNWYWFDADCLFEDACF